MNDQKWASVVEKIKDKFELEEEGLEDLDNGGKREFYEFDSPLGRLMVERVVRPRLLDKKTIYSNRIGSGTKTEYCYSEDEFVDFFSVYKWSDDLDDWEELGDETVGNFIM